MKRFCEHKLELVGFKKTAEEEFPIFRCETCGIATTTLYIAIYLNLVDIVMYNVHVRLFPGIRL